MAHEIGANANEQSKKIFREGLIICFTSSALLSVIGISLSPHLPMIMGAKPEIWPEASAYFFIYSCAIPAMTTRIFSASVFQCTGDMKTPSIFNSLLCFFDILFLLRLKNEKSWMENRLKEMK